MNLEQLAQGLAMDAAFWAAAIPGDSLPLARAGRASLDVGSDLRALAILALLARADGRQFCANLARSGDAWRHFVVRASGATGSIPHFASGRVAPVFDALAAGDLDGVRAIGRAAPATLQAGKEYVDSFCTARAVFALVDDQPIAALLERLAAFAEDHPRVPMLAALQARDQAGYEAALAGILGAFERETAALLERGAEDTPRFRVDRSICIEAVAWQRLARVRGLRPAAEARACPSLALEPHAGAWPREFSGG